MSTVKAIRDGSVADYYVSFDVNKNPTIRLGKIERKGKGTILYLGANMLLL